MHKKIYFLLEELTFIRITIQSGVPQSLHDHVNILHVLCNIV